MAITYDEFVRSLTDCGLMEADEVQAFIDLLPLENRPRTAEALAKEMFRKGRLTKFQAQAIYQGKTRGLVVGNYVVEDKLGQGGMGAVYKARHRRMKRLVALKMLPSEATRSPEAVKRFQQEVEAAAKLTHPNIVTAFDADEHRGVHFLVMEYVEGQDLHAYVRENGTLSVAKAIDFILQAAKGLEYAHKHGVIHRDIKPSNLLLDKEGVVNILDMGLARIEAAIGGDDATEDEGLTHSGEVMGTVDYMSPEQGQNTKWADERSDIYSLGCTLWFLLIGRSVYRGGTLVEKILAHREQAIPSLRDVRPEVPESLDLVFQTMLAKAGRDRQQSMSEVIAQLQACQGTGKEGGPASEKAFAETLSFLQGTPAKTDPDTATAVEPPSAPSSQASLDDLFTDQAVPLSSRLYAPSGHFLAVLHNHRPLLFVAGGIALTVLVLVGMIKVLTSGGQGPKGDVAGPDEKSQAVVKEQTDPTVSKQSTGNGAPAISSENDTVALSSSKGWQFGEPVNLGPIVNSEWPDLSPSLSGDGLTLVFASARPEGQNDADLWMCRRASLTAPFGKPVNLGPEINSSTIDANPALSTDGLTLFFDSTRVGGQGHRDLWMCRRASIDTPFGTPVNLGPTVNSDYRDGSPAISADGLTLVFDSERPGGYGAADLWMCRRTSLAAPFDAPVNLGPFINSSAYEMSACLSRDDLTLFFHSSRPRRPGEQPVGNLWMCSRRTVNDAFDEPVNVHFNDEAQYREPWLSADGQTLYFQSNRPGGLGDEDLWMAPIRWQARSSRSTAAAPPLAIAPFDATTARKHQEAWAKYLGLPVEFENSIGMKLVLIPPGEFMMGSSEAQIEAITQMLGDRGEILLARPLHRVRISSPFYLATTELTVGQFRQFVDATDYATWVESSGTGGSVLHRNEKGIYQVQNQGLTWRTPGFAQTEMHPVVQVSWDDAVAFCTWMSKRENAEYGLPTEAQWEYACRAGSEAIWFFGNDESQLERHAWYGDLERRLQPVGGKLGNGFGLYDTYGNVWEWCFDYFDAGYYRRSPECDPRGPKTGDVHVKRGGGYDAPAAKNHTAFRFAFVGLHATHSFGFRPMMAIATDAPTLPRRGPKLHETE